MALALLSVERVGEGHVLPILTETPQRPVYVPQVCRSHQVRTLLAARCLRFAVNYQRSCPCYASGLRVSCAFERTSLYCDHFETYPCPTQSLGVCALQCSPQVFSSYRAYSYGQYSARLRLYEFRSKRSLFMTLVHAFTKSATNFTATFLADAVQFLRRLSTPRALYISDYLEDTRHRTSVCVSLSTTRLPVVMSVMSSTSRNMSR